MTCPCTHGFADWHAAADCSGGEAIDVKLWPAQFDTRQNGYQWRWQLYNLAVPSTLAKSEYFASVTLRGLIELRAYHLLRYANTKPRAACDRLGPKLSRTLVDSLEK